MAQGDVKAVHLRIYGIVQGVGFRFFTERVANRYGLSGWVRNLPDGSVEAYLVGDPEVLKYAIQEIKVGPPSARVTEVVENWFDNPPETPPDFQIRF